jgi:tetratricopeptide (TPR) repeat protein
MNRILAAGAAMLVLAGALIAAPALAQGGAGQKPPFAGGDPNAKDPEVEKLVAAAAKLEKQSNAKPKDAKLKQKVGEAYYQAGHTMMVSPKLVSKVKYPGALKLFRTALKFDPKHARAAEEKKTIEDIYKSLGRPVPG